MNFGVDLSDLELDSEFLFIKFDGHGNGRLSLASGTDRLPGVAAMMQKVNPIPNMVDYETLEPLPFEWMKLGVPLELRKYSTAAQPDRNWLFCFKTEPAFEPYAAENINNGYLRPYRQPNLWISDGDEGQWFEMEFPEPVSFSDIRVTLDSNLNYRIRNLKPYDFGVIPEIAADFDILLDGVKIASVRDNNQRYVKVAVPEQTGKILRFNMLKTNGSRNFGVYNISVY